MPSITRTTLNKKAVLYARGAFDKFGEQSVDEGIQIKARWELGSSWVIDNFSSTEEADGVVWVDRVVTKGSLLYKGGLADLPSPVTDLYEVVDYTEIPDTKGRDVERVVLIRRFRDALPTVNS
jgi:hypothetical protein